MILRGETRDSSGAGQTAQVSYIVNHTRQANASGRYRHVLDSYLGPLAQLLRRGATPDDVAAHLRDLRVLHRQCLGAGALAALHRVARVRS